MFQLSPGEFENLKSQIVTSSWGGMRRAAPYAFTEQGVAMLSMVLRSRRATGSAEPSSLSGGFPARVDPRRGGQLEVAFCDLKMGRPPQPTARLYGARRDHGG